MTMQPTPSQMEGSKTGVEALASLPPNQLFSYRKNNSIYYIIKAVLVILIQNENNSNNNKNNNSELFSLNEETYQNISRVFCSTANRRIVEYFINYGAATGLNIEKTLNIDQATVYRNLNFLCNIGFIIPSRTKLERPKGLLGGRKVILYQSPEAKPEQVIEAEQLNNRLCNPRFISAERIAQLIMDDYFFKKPNELNTDQIKYVLRKMKVQDILGMCDLVCIELRKTYGQRVWRS